VQILIKILKPFNINEDMNNSMVGVDRSSLFRRLWAV